MAVKNREISKTLEQIADLLEIQDANEFRVRSYRNAARTISGLSDELCDLVDAGEDLSELPDIGESMAEKIHTLLEEGELPQLKELEEQVPPELRELLDIEGLGAKRVAALYGELGVKTVDGLLDAAQSGKVHGLEGFGEKTEQNIIREIERIKADVHRGRFLWSVADEIVTRLVGYLRESEGVQRAVAAGSYRRKQETVGDLDILVVCDFSEPVMDRFLGHEDVDRVVSRGETRSTVMLRSGMQVDLRVVGSRSYGAALQYFTGSKEHSVALRKMAVEQDLKVNEYGVYQDDEWIAGVTEEDVYHVFDLPVVPPELRENSGEIEAASRGELPTLLELSDMRGDLQSHTTESDGKNSLEEMAERARDIGYEYLAVTDHSKRVTMANGLDAERLSAQLRQIDELNGEFDGFRLLKAIEVDVLKDGSLDLPDDILERCDLVCCAVHYDRNLSRDDQTSRILAALGNPHVNVLVHPTGRIIGGRPGYEVDMDRVMEAARKHRCFLEINAQPDRLDISDTMAKKAKEMGVQVSISTDAHRTDELDFMRYGVYQARRGWLTAEDVINTRPCDELTGLLQESSGG